MNPLSNFDFSVLDGNEYGEDAVREDIVAPLLKALGYSPNGESTMIRSRRLTHPYVYIGSRRHGVSIIPDYTLEPSKGTTWILDAKAPRENILRGKNAEQAYSYAMHPDVRALRYALCNGHSLSIFHVSKIEPEEVVKIDGLSETFQKLFRLLSPIAFTNPKIFNFKPDLGIALLKMGYTPETKINFYPMGLTFIVMLSAGKYSALVNIGWGEDWMATSFDFVEEQYQQLLNAVSPMQCARIRLALSKQPFKVDLKVDPPVVNIDAALGENIYQNEDESYCPLQVHKFGPAL